VDNNNVLHVSTSRRDEREDRGERGGWTYHRIERSAGSSYRSVRLPQNVDTSRVAATCENGVLNITVPKMEAGAQGRKQISIA
jgi:HSP20 family protein